MSQYTRELSDSEWENIINHLYPHKIDIFGVEFSYGQIVRHINPILFNEEREAFLKSIGDDDITDLTEDNDNQSVRHNNVPYFPNPKEIVAFYDSNYFENLLNTIFPSVMVIDEEVGYGTILRKCNLPKFIALKIEFWKFRSQNKDNFTSKITANIVAEWSERVTKK